MHGAGCGAGVFRAGHIGLIGARSLVGHFLLRHTSHSCSSVLAYTRVESGESGDCGVEWRRLPRSSVERNGLPAVEHWIYLSPIWTLPEHFALLEAHGVRRIVALSSTSRFTKRADVNPADERENAIAQQLIDGEERVVQWATSRGIEWVILRPTLIYGLGEDKNLSEMARFVRRFGFFPLFGDALGLRQPIHADDVARGALAALHSETATNCAYNIAGGEAIPYREMVARIFVVDNRKPIFIKFPRAIFNLALFFMRKFPRFQSWSIAAVERMNQDLVFDSSDAARDFGFHAQVFKPVHEDLLISARIPVHRM